MLFRRLIFLAFFCAAFGCASLHAQRQMESLGRGIVVLRSSSTQVYVGWRLLGNDPEDVAFNLYRSANGATAVKVNSTPITTTTNYVDTPANLGTVAYTYSIRPALNGIEVPDTWANPLSGPVTLPINAPVRQYIPVPIQPTPDDAVMGVSYRVKFCWVGDVDGDGEYDFIIERSNPDVEAKQWLQAYKRDGTLLWQMDMGPNSVNHYNITPGSSAIAIGHGDNVTVYDLDGDGKAEVIVRTANGVVFGNGTTLVAPNDEVQYISIIDGLTGLEKARSKINIPTTWVNQNHVNGQMGIVYADGMRPSIFFHASNRNPDESFNHVAYTWDFRNGSLTQRWVWPFTGHTAEGHQIRLSDVDNDGKDEYIDIGHVLKSDGSGQINEAVLTEVVHGDRFHVADIDPDRPGLETFLIQQNNSTGLATVYQAADKSAVIKKAYAGGVVDVGRGTIGAFVPSLFGLQMFSTQPGVFDAKGNQVYATQPFPPETIWWDGDLGREFVATIGSDAVSPGIDKFNTANASTSRLFSIYSDPAAPNSPYNNYTANAGRPQFWGDILGDWREELLCVATDNSELRIYTTKIPDVAKTGGGVPVRIYTLMHNPQYRIQATTKGYVQSSYVDYYLGYGMTPPQPPPMVQAKLVWRGGTGTTTWDAGTTSSWLNNGTASTFTDGDTVRLDISGNNATAVTLNGTLQPGALTVYSPIDYTFAGSGVLAGTMKLTKAGAGALVIPGTHTFSGKTTVWDGALVVNGNLQNSPITVWGGTWGGAAAGGKTGGRIAGIGQFSQPVTVKYRGAITPGAGMNSTGTLTFANGLTAEDGATFALDLSDDPTGVAKANDRIAITGNLALTGTVKIVINALNTKLAAGNYTLATYSGALTGGVANLAVTAPVGTPYTLSASGGAITLTVASTRPAAAVTWSGAGGNWDIATSSNWLRSNAADVFVAGDSVLFDSTGAANSTVTLSTALPTAGVTVNSSTNYTFSGTGSIDGTGGLTKSGSGTLTVNTNNNYTGPTLINGGVLAVAALGDAGSPSSIGASTAEASNLIINGGTLSLTGLQTNMNRNVTLGASGGTFDIPVSGSSIQISGALVGSGSLTKTGPGTLILVATNTFTGGTVINGGKVYLAGGNANSNALGSGTVTINNGTLSMSDVQNNITAAWNVIVPTGATARLEADGRSSLTGSLTGGGNFTFYSPYVRTDLKGNWSAFTGKINVVGASGGADFRIANAFGFANVSLDLGTDISAYYNLALGSSGLTLGIGELSGSSATASLSGGPTAGRTLTWQIGGKNTDSTYAGIIKNGTGPTALIKIGTGTLTLSGANTYTGATAVNAGKLALRGGSLTSSAITVANGAGFGGNGAVTGNVSYAANSTLLANPLTGPLAITGNLTFAGAVSIAPVAGATLSEGTYPLYTYTGTLTGTPAFSWSVSGFSATFDTSVAGTVSITLVAIPRDPADITWTGSVSSTWDTTALNWLWTNGTTRFISADRVIFDDSSTANTVTLASAVTPASITVNASQDYTFSGSGSISGGATLTKSGTGTLTISTAQTFTGGTTLTDGTLVLGNAAALGTGDITLAGGTLATGALSPANSLVVTDDSRITGGNSGGSQGIRAVSGSGLLTLESTSVFDLEGSLADFNGTVALTGTGGFRFFGGAGSGAAAWDLGTRGLAARSGAAYALGSLTGTAGSTLSTASNNSSATTTYTIGAINTDTTFAGVISNGGTKLVALTKTGTGSLTLSGANTYTGATAVSAGALYITGSLAATAVNVSSGATIGGTGTLAGNLTIASGGRLALGIGSSSTTGLTVSGTTTLNGTITVVPVFLGGSLAPGTYSFLNYTGTLAGTPSFAWSDTTGSGYTATFSTATTGKITVTLRTPLQTWRQSNFAITTSTGNAANAFDSDGDGLPNLLEYAVGSSPTNATSAAFPATQTIASNGQTFVAVTFNRIADPALTYNILGSSDLSSWTSLWSSTGSANIPGPVTVPDTVPLSTGTRRFLRLQISTSSP